MNSQLSESQGPVLACLSAERTCAKTMKKTGENETEKEGSNESMVHSKTKTE